LGNKRVKRRFELKILDEVYPIQSTSDESHVRGIEAYLNEKLEDIKSQARSLTPRQLFILASLDIVDEFLSLKEKHEKQEGEFLSLKDKQEKQEKERLIILEEVEAVYKQIDERLSNLGGIPE